MNGLFSLVPSDLIKGAVAAAFSAVSTAIFGVVGAQGFDLFTADWKVILGTALFVGANAFVGYLVKNFLSTSDDKLLGKVRM